MMTPIEPFAPPARSDPPPFWYSEEPVREPEEDRLPDEVPNPNPDENRHVPPFSQVH